MFRKASFIILALLIIMTVPFGNVEPSANPKPVESTIAQTFVSANVLVDEYHTRNASEMWTPGNASLFGWLLAKHGYNVSTNWFESLDSGILDSYDVLCLFFPMAPLNATEITAIQNFVSNGGGLLLVGVDNNPQSWGYSAVNLNPLSEGYGITFNSDALNGIARRSNGEIADHNLTYSVESMYSTNDDLKGCSLTVSSPATSLVTIKGSDFVAYATSGSGRVVAVGSAGPFMQLRSRISNLVDPDDHAQFSLDVIDWLSGNSPREVDTSGKAVIKIRPGPDLNESELADYKVFTGYIHDHTTYSDGQNTAFEMITRAVETAADFFVITDHSYDKPAKNGIYGAIAANAIQDKYDLDCEVFVGAELSAIPHTVGFPLTEQIYATSTQEAVDGIHAQGGIAILCHPTLASKYAAVWEKFEDYGYDAFEVDNMGFFHGLGEQAYFWSFDIASDTHNAKILGNFRNVFFVKSPTGPDGKISAEDIMDAIRNRRNVVVDLYNKLVFGDSVWVDRYLELWDQAESLISTVQSQIDALESSGKSIELAKTYLAEAQNAMDWWNPSRAIELAQNAESELILGFDIAIMNPDLGLIESGSTVTLKLNVTNELSYGVKANLTIYIGTSLVFDRPSLIIEAAPHTSQVMEFNITALDFGYTKIVFNLHDFNTTYQPRPVWLHVSGLISAVNVTEELRDDGIRVTIKLLRGSTDMAYVSSVKIHYRLNDADTIQVVNMENYGDGWGYRLNGMTAGTNITFTIYLVDDFGHTYIIEGSHIVGYTGGGGLTVDPLVPAGIGIAVGFVAVVIVLMKKFKS